MSLALPWRIYGLLLLWLLFCRDASAWVVKIHRPKEATKRISKLQVTSKDAEVKTRRDHPQECYVAIDLVFTPEGRSLLQDERTLFVPQIGGGQKIWKGTAERRLNGTVTPLHLVATRPDGAIEEEKIFIVFREWSQSKTCTAEKEKSKPAPLVEKPAEPRKIAPPPVPKEDKGSLAPEPALALPRRFQASIGPEYFLLKRENASLSGASLALSGRYSWANNLGVALSYSHGFEFTNGLNSAYLAFDLGVVLSITGTLTAVEHPSTIPNAPSSPLSRWESPWGFNAKLFLVQYFFLGSSAIPMTGGGLQIQYDFPSAASWNSFLGLKGGTAFGSGIPVYLFHLRVGISLYP